MTSAQKTAGSITKPGADSATGNRDVPAAKKIDTMSDKLQAQKNKSGADFVASRQPSASPINRFNNDGSAGASADGYELQIKKLGAQSSISWDDHVSVRHLLPSDDSTWHKFPKSYVIKFPDSKSARLYWDYSKDNWWKSGFRIAWSPGLKECRKIVIFDLGPQDTKDSIRSVATGLGEILQCSVCDVQGCGKMAFIIYHTAHEATVAEQGLKGKGYRVEASSRKWGGSPNSGNHSGNADREGNGAEDPKLPEDDEDARTPRISNRNFAASGEKRDRPHGKYNDRRSDGGDSSKRFKRGSPGAEQEDAEVLQSPHPGYSGRGSVKDDREQSQSGASASKGARVGNYLSPSNLTSEALQQRSEAEKVDELFGCSVSQVGSVAPSAFKPHQQCPTFSKPVNPSPSPTRGNRFPGHTMHSQVPERSPSNQNIRMARCKHCQKEHEADGCPFHYPTTGVRYTVPMYNEQHDRYCYTCKSRDHWTRDCIVGDCQIPEMD